MKQFFLSLLILSFSLTADKNIDLNAKPEKGAVVLFDGTHETFLKEWIYWEGPGFLSQMPVKWKFMLLLLLTRITNWGVLLKR